MNFQNINYLPFLLVGFIAIAGLMLRQEFKFFKIIKLYWFHNRSLYSWASSFLFLSGMFLLLLSLLDMRGPEQRVKSQTPIQRTIILMDTSASMLAEDVRPSRIQKAVLIAKHFARKAVSHQLSVVAFAETQKKIVPFTKDLDLIDARLDSLKTLRNQNGSSALSLAIQESIQYFKETGEARGNILILTDGEETTNGIDLQVSKDIHIALVGIGTTQGGKIPLDDGRGFRFGYKKFKGTDVVTKLNDNFFKKVVSDLPSAKYWPANSYSLPSDEIFEFFSTQGTKGDTEQDLVIRPVMMEWIVIPAIILLTLSFIFKMFKTFTLALILVMPTAFSKDVELPQETIIELEKLKQGKLSTLERIKLADELNKQGAKDESLAIYEENLPYPEIDRNIPPEAYLNFGTALLEKGNEEQGLAMYESLLNELDSKKSDQERMKKIIKNNITKYFKSEEQKEQKKKEQEKNKDSKEQDKDKKEGEEGESENDGEGKDGKDQKKPSKNEEDEEDKKGDKENKEQKEKDNKSDKDDEDLKDKELDKGDSDNEKKLPPKKIPAKLKQLMSDDRQLQMKMIERGTRDLNKRSKNRNDKDW